MKKIHSPADINGKMENQIANQRILASWSVANL